MEKNESGADAKKSSDSKSVEKKKKPEVSKSEGSKKASGKSPKKEIHWGKLVGVIVAVVLIAVVAFAIIMGLGVYKKRWDKDLKDTPVLGGIVKMYPVMWVDSQPITFGDYWTHVNAMKHFFGNQMGVDFESEEGQQMLGELESQVKEKLRDEAIISQLLKKHGVTVTQQDLEDEFQKYLDQIKQQAEAVGQEIGNAEEEALKMFEQQFGWTTKEEVLEYAIRPYVEQQKLQEKFEEDGGYKEEAKQEAEEVLEKVKADPDKFADLAKEYSDDVQSAEMGGELGFFGKGMMVAEFEEVVFALEPGQISDEVVETEYGYHIIKVLEVDEEKEEIKAAHILIMPFGSWYEKEKEQIDVSEWL